MVNYSPQLSIKGTPLQFNMIFQENGAGPLKDHPLIGNGHLTGFGEELGLALNAISTLGQFVEPLDQKFNGFWTLPSTQSEIKTQFQNQITQQPATKGVDAGSGASNFRLTAPQQGSLNAMTGPVTAKKPNGDPLVPAQYLASATQLSLQYLLPGFTFTWDNGSFLSQTCTYWITFDGEIDLFLAMAQDPRVGPGVAAFFTVSNISPDGNTAAGAKWAAAGCPSRPSNPPDQTVRIDSLTMGLLDGLLNISAAMTAAYGSGFTTVAPKVTPDALSPAPGGNTVEIDLTHPLDAAPVITNALIPTPSLFAAEIGATPTQLHVGDTLTVVGSNFPPTQTNQLTIKWSETPPTSGVVTESVVSYGQALNTSTPPTNPTTVKISRTGPNAGTNQYTATGLLPNTLYGFQVQDFEVYSPGIGGLFIVLIGTPPSAWTYLQTAATDQVQLILSDPTGVHNWPLGSTTLQPASGTFPPTRVTIPDGTNPPGPGPYNVVAVLGGQQMAQTPITIIASATTVPPQLQILNDQGIPFSGAPVVMEGGTVRVQGSNFGAGSVSLVVGNATGPTGPPIGSVMADPSGSISPVDVMWPWAAGLGPLAMWAQQGSEKASAPVFSETAQ
jgi:hypothetical protein